MESQQTHLVSATGASGPRIDVLMRIFDRIAEFEHEVETGQRVIAEPLPIRTQKKKGKKHATENTTPLGNNS